MRYTYLLTGCLLFMMIVAKAQTKTSYEVLIEGKTIGNLITTKEVKGTKIIKTLSTDIDQKQFDLNNIIESEVLVETEGDLLKNTTSFRNSKRETEDLWATTVRGQGNTYDITKGSEKIELTHVGIKFCLADMYFKEPLGITAIYSSANAQFFKIYYVSAGVYRLALPEGKSAVFTYLNGAFTQAEVTTKTDTIVIKKAK